MSGAGVFPSDPGEHHQGAQPPTDPTKLRNDPETQAAAQLWIEVLCAANPDVPWRKIIGRRIILAHAYFHIDQDIVGSIVSDEIPELRRHLAAALEGLDG